nr:2-C-methyl-D-erythritol 2,4-cyclodiphosphate synthase [Desulfobacterales bacterium]
MRVGFGYDVHRLVEGRKLVIGGVHIPHSKGLLGHSDADVLIHAICDALLGAAGLGDIGQHFPDTDPELKDVSSLKLLAKIYRLIKAKGFMIENIDTTILAQAPKMAPYSKAMQAKIAPVLELDEGLINIKAKTTEGLGIVGTGAAIAAACVAMLRKRRW